MHIDFQSHGFHHFISGILQKTIGKIHGVSSPSEMIETKCSSSCHWAETNGLIRHRKLDFSHHNETGIPIGSSRMPYMVTFTINIP